MNNLSARHKAAYDREQAEEEQARDHQRDLRRQANRWAAWGSGISAGTRVKPRPSLDAYDARQAFAENLHPHEKD